MVRLPVDMFPVGFLMEREEENHKGGCITDPRFYLKRTKSLEDEGKEESL